MKCYPQVLIAALLASFSASVSWMSAIGPDTVVDIIPDIDFPASADIDEPGKAKGRLKVYRTTMPERKGIFLTVGGFGGGLNEKPEDDRPELKEGAGDEHDYEGYLDKGFDVYIMSWYDGTEYMQKNAMVLVELLERIHSGPVPDGEGGLDLSNALVDEEDEAIVEVPLGPEEKLALVVPSMGGIVSRYALCYLETGGTDHGVDLWMTLDSPHTGAYIPIGIQYMAHYLNSVTWGIKAQKQLDLVNSPAAKQLLMLHHTRAENPLTPLYHPFHEAFYSELEEVYGNYPTAPGLRRVALSNGAGDGRYSQIVDGEMTFFDLPKSEPRVVRKNLDFRVLKADKKIEIKVKDKVIWDAKIDFELRLGLVMDAWSTRPNTIISPLVFRADGGIIVFINGKRTVFGLERAKDKYFVRGFDAAEHIAVAISDALDIPNYVPDWATESAVLNAAYDILERAYNIVSPSNGSARVSTDYAYEYLPGGLGGRHVEAAGAIKGTAIGDKVCFIPATSGIGYTGALDTPLKQISASDTPFDQIYFEESLPSGDGNRNHVFFDTLAQEKIDAELDALRGVPAVFTTVPRNTSVDSTSTTLTVVLEGQNFTPQTQAYWNGSSRTTAYLNENQVRITITAADVDEAGSNEISITDPGWPEIDPPPVSFKVVPVDINVLPSNWGPGDPATFIYTGVAKLVPVPADPIVSIDGDAITVTASQGGGFFVLRPYEIEADLGNPPAGEYTITYKVNDFVEDQQVRNLLIPEPFILNASPSSISDVDGPIALEITGSGFFTSDHVPVNERTQARWNGITVSADALSREFLSVEVPARESLFAINTLEIENPEPGGGVVSFEIPFDGPVILDARLSHVLDGETRRQQLEVDGESYTESTAIYWNGTKLATEFVDETKLRAFVPDDLATSPGSVKLSTRYSDDQIVPDYTVQQIPPFGVLVVKKGTLDGDDGLSWETAFDRFEDALAAAEPGQEIWVAAGTYAPPYIGPNTGFELVDGVAIYGGFTGSEIFRDQRNPDPETNGTVLSADRLEDDANFGGKGDNTLSVAGGVALSESTVLDGFKLRAANGTASGSQGGGLKLVDSDILLRNLIIEDSTSMSGGGLYVEGGSPQISDTIIRSNSSNEGGGVMVSGGSPQFDRVIVIGNRSAQGGGFYLVSGADPTISNSVIAGNDSPSGGGIRSFESSASLSYVTLSGNVGGARGGAISNLGIGLYLENCIIWGNTAPEGPSIDGLPIALASVGNTIEGGHAVGSDTSEADPLFVASPDSGEDEKWYPDIGDNNYGNLRLLKGSPAIGSGAYEGEYDAFVTVHPGLTADEDANYDGIVNVLAYLLGGNPEADARIENINDVIEKSDDIYFDVTIRSDDGEYEMETYVSPNMSIWYPLSETAGFQVEIENMEALPEGLNRIRGRLLLDPSSQSSLFIRSEGTPKSMMSGLRSLP